MPKQVSQARVAANQRNARKSTGPRTAEGKTRSAQNSRTHGLLAESTALPPGALNAAIGPVTSDHHTALLAAFTADLHPSGTLETALVARLASLQHRLHRITTIESGLFDLSIPLALNVHPEYAEPGQQTIEDCIAAPGSLLLADAYTYKSRSLNLLSFYEARLSRDFHRTLAELRRTQAARLAADDNRRDQPLPAADPASQSAPPPATTLDAENEQTNPTTTQIPEITSTSTPAPPTVRELATIPTVAGSNAQPQCS